MRPGAVIPWNHFNPRIEEGLLAQFDGFASETELCASANRSLTPAQAKKLCWAYSVLCIAVVAATYLQGNVIAPVFLLINAGILAFAARLVWRASDSGDYVRVSPEGCVEVWRKRRGQVAKTTFVGPPRAIWEREALWLVAGNKRELVAEFLNPDQRSRFFEHLERLIHLANAPLVSKLQVKIIKVGCDEKHSKNSD
jgi:uncharacterized membrane protein